MAQDATLQLNSNHKMPVIGLGTWQAPAGQVGAAVKTALENGYRHVDCAAVYGADNPGAMGQWNDFCCDTTRPGICER